MSSRDIDPRVAPFSAFRRAARRWRGPIATHVLAFAPFALSCSAPEPREPTPIDCGTPDEKYEFRILQPFEAGQTLSWFGVVDSSPRAEVGVDDPATPELDYNPVIEAIEDVPELGEQEPGRCGNTSAVVFRAKGFTDWGGFFAEYATVGQNIPGSEVYEGVSFWARSAPGSSPYFTLSIDNALTAPIVEDLQSPENLCVSPIDDGIEGNVDDYPPGTDPSDACGNSFVHNVATTDEWQFFTIPFSEFWQDPARPNVEPDGLDPTVQLVRFRVGFPTESRIELYMDDLGLYREW